MSARRWVARGLLAVIVVAVLGAAGYGLVRLVLEPWAARHAEERIAAQLGVPARVGAARIRLPAVVELTDVSTARGRARHVVVRVVPSALLVGDARLALAIAEDVEVSGRGTAGRVELLPASESSDGREHLRVYQARHARRPLAADVVLLDLDEDRAPRGVTLHGGSWDGVRGIEASAAREADTWTVRVSWQGLRGSLRATSGEHLSLDAELHLTDAPMPARPVPWIDLSQARASGSLRVSGTLDDLVIKVGLQGRGVNAWHRALASEPARDLDGAVSGALHVARAGRLIETERLELRRRGAAVIIAGRVDRDGASDVKADLGQTRCADLLSALSPVLPALRGMEVSGEIAAHVRVTADARRLADLALDAEVDVGCGVVRDAPGADPGRLRLLGQVAALAGDPVRSLEQVGMPVVRAFLVGEDARFFRHRGFDPWTIRRALAADLAAGAFVRGASTITQQLARNLYLDGDRNVARKIEEAVIAWRLEQTARKREILEAWLHLIELGPGIRGVSDGARAWFARDPAQLDEDQAARLAALAPAPRRGFDEAWARRYRDLSARMAAARPEIPGR